MWEIHPNPTVLQKIGASFSSGTSRESIYLKYVISKLNIEVQVFVLSM